MEREAGPGQEGGRDVCCLWRFYPDAAQAVPFSALVCSLHGFVGSLVQLTLQLFSDQGLSRGMRSSGQRREDEGLACSLSDSRKDWR